MQHMPTLSMGKRSTLACNKSVVSVCDAYIYVVCMFIFCVRYDFCKLVLTGENLFKNSF